MNERVGEIGVYISGVPWRVLSVWWRAVGSLVRMVSDDEHMAQTTQMVRDTFFEKFSV